MPTADTPIVDKGLKAIPRRLVFLGAVGAGLLPIVAQAVFTLGTHWTPLGHLGTVKPVTEQAWLASFLFFGVTLGATTLSNSWFKGTHEDARVTAAIASAGLYLTTFLMLLFFGIVSSYESGADPRWLWLNGSVVALTVVFSYILDTRTHR